MSAVTDGGIPGGRLRIPLGDLITAVAKVETVVDSIADELGWSGWLVLVHSEWRNLFFYHDVRMTGLTVKAFPGPEVECLSAVTSPRIYALVDVRSFAGVKANTLLAYSSVDSTDELYRQRLAGSQTCRPGGIRRRANGCWVIAAFSGEDGPRADKPLALYAADLLLFMLDISAQPPDMQEFVRRYSSVSVMGIPVDDVVSFARENIVIPV